MEIFLLLGGVVATLVAAYIGYQAAMRAATHQTIALEKSTSEQIAQLKEQLKTQRDEFAVVVRQLDVSSVGMTSSELTAIDEWLVQYARFRPCFYDGLEINEIKRITNEDKERVKAIAARLVNAYATILLQSRRVPESMEFNTAWVNATIARRYGNSPSCCDHLLLYIEEYPVTGEHQFKLMLKGLIDSLAIAKMQKDQKRVKRLTARITNAQAAWESISNKLSLIREKDIIIDDTIFTRQVDT